YSALRQQSVQSGNPQISIVPSILGITAKNGSFYTDSPENHGWAINEPIVTGSVAKGMYAIMYILINRANYVIQQVGRLKNNDFSDPDRKNQIIAEAKGLRALGHFYLLRLWGQFYNPESKYGINIRIKPSESPTAQPRNTVQETYDIIIKDLDDVINNAPDLREKYYISKTFGKAMKAKVLLYKGEYQKAATLAKEVMDNGNTEFALISSFDKLFDHTTINT